MKTLNFTQFCHENGFIDDYSVLNHAALSPSGHMSQIEHSHQMDLHLERLKSNKHAHELFYNAVKDGSIIDLGGELVREKILMQEAKKADAKSLNEISIIEGKIRFIESLGGMSHLQNGQLKKNYKMQVDYYLNQIEQLKTQNK